MRDKPKKRAEEEADPWKTRRQSSTPSKQQDKGEGDLGIRLRAEMLPASQASPRFRAYRRRFFTAGRFGAFLILVGLAGLGWYFGIGPGRPGLEKKLVALVGLARSYTQPTATLLPTDAPMQPIPSATFTPTAVTIRPIASNTPTQAPFTPVQPSITVTVTPTATVESTCLDFSTITLDQIGEEVCVQGTVIEVIENLSDTLILFSYNQGSFYLVTYDVDWPEGTIGTCYQVTGEIQRLLSSPVIVFGYNNLPTECP